MGNSREFTKFQFLQNKDKWLVDIDRALVDIIHFQELVKVICPQLSEKQLASQLQNETKLVGETALRLTEHSQQLTTAWNAHDALTSDNQ